MGFTSHIYHLNLCRFLFAALALQNFTQLAAVGGDQILFQRAGLKFHHDVIVIGGNQAVAAFKVGDLHRFRVGQVQGLLDPFCLVILQVEDNLGFAVVDNAFPKTALVQIEKVVQVLAGADR